MAKDMASTRRFFYGYWILLSAFLFQFFTSGPAYVFTLFVKPLEAEFGWSRSEVMVASLIGHLTMGAASPFIGRLVDRYSAKKIIAAGGLLAGLGFVLLSTMQTLWVFYAAQAIINIGNAGGGVIPSSVVISNWFQKRRGMAVGIMGVGVGVGGMVISPVVGGFLIPNLGFRSAYLCLGLTIAAVIFTVSLLIVKTKPGDIGCQPNGVQGEVKTGEAATAVKDGLSLPMALRTPAFYLIALSIAAFSVPMMAMFANQAPYLEEVGFSVATVSAAVGAVGLGSAIGKFSFGWVTDFIRPKYAFALGIGLQAVAMAILMTLSQSSPDVMLWLYAVVSGLGSGVWLPCTSMIVSRTFGLKAYGTILGVIFLVLWVSGALGPVVAGTIYDRTGSYELAFVVFLVMLIISIAAMLLVRRPNSYRGGS